VTHSLAHPNSPDITPHALSTDFLNRYAEALMLIELFAGDPSVIADLEAWRPVTYRQHFAGSRLRCAASALAGYDALDFMSRGAFDSLCSAMDRLIDTVILTLREITDPNEALPIIAVAAEAFRSLLTRATAFINSGGDRHEAVYSRVDLQQAIDRFIAG
jgi:hypothetical protein